MTEHDPFSLARSRTPGGAELFIPRRAEPSANSEPLAVLAGRYLDCRREFNDRQATDSEVEEFNESQAKLLEQMENTPAVTLDDLVAKLEVINEEIVDRISGDNEQLEPADRLTRTLADDLRRVIGATTAYRFDPRLWVESAIRAGMEPIAMIYLAPRIGDRRQGALYEVKRRLCLNVAGVNPAYEPPRLSIEQRDAVIDELERRGFADYYRLSAEPAPG